MKDTAETWLPRRFHQPAGQVFPSSARLCRLGTCGSLIILLLLRGTGLAQAGQGSGLLDGVVDSASERPSTSSSGFILDTALWQGATIRVPGRPEPDIVTRKLQAAFIPELDFKNTSLSDALEALRKAMALATARRYGPDSNWDVSIFLKLPAKSIPAPTAAPANDLSDAYDPSAAPGRFPSAVDHTYPRITLKLRNVSVIEAFEQIAKAAGMKFKMEPFAAAILPADADTRELMTVEIDVPADFPRRTAVAGRFGPGGNQSLEDGHLDARGLFEAAGMKFPPGASATYLPGKSMFVIRNTEEDSGALLHLPPGPPSKDPRGRRP